MKVDDEFVLTPGYKKFQILSIAVYRSYMQQPFFDQVLRNNSQGIFDRLTLMSIHDQTMKMPMRISILLLGYDGG